jgi:hypothetical protein
MSCPFCGEENNVIGLGYTMSPIKRQEMVCKPCKRPYWRVFGADGSVVVVTEQPDVGFHEPLWKGVVAAL